MTVPRSTRRSARSSWTARWSPATCAGGRCVRSPPTSACTGGPSRPIVTRSAWNVASPSKGRRPASSAPPRWLPAWSLTRRCARAARMPEQRRRKAVAALAAIPPPVVAQANRERAGRRLNRVAAEVASRHGYPDLGTFVLARVEQGASLAVISREAGLNKDWLSRHLGCVDPAAAEAARLRRPQRLDARWQPALTRLGFADVASYLHERHIVQHRTVNAIAAEAGLAHHAVENSLRRHGLARMPHAAKRHAASQRAAQAAARLGFDTMPGYIADRRAAGWTWHAMAEECAQPPSWLRRQARGDRPPARTDNHAERPAGGSQVPA